MNKFITNRKPLTAPQAVALAKYRDGTPRNNIAAGVRNDLMHTLHDKGFLERKVMLHDSITKIGTAALAAYDRGQK
jgi:hypothetical protein